MQKKLYSVAQYIQQGEKDTSPASQLMFFAPFCIWAFVSVLYRYTSYYNFINPYLDYDALRYTCLTLLVVRELLFCKWDRLAFTGFTILTWMASMALIAHYNALFDTMCFAFAARNIPFRRIAIASFSTSAAIIIIVVVSSQVGIIPDALVSRSATDIQRHHLGFTHPNTCPGLFFLALCAWTCVRKKNYGIVDMLIALVVVAYLFSMTNSRTANMMSALVAVGALIVAKAPEKYLRNPLCAVVGIGSVAICCFAAVALAWFYDPSVGWMASLNSALSGRLALGHNAFQQYGMPLVGQHVDLYSMSVRYDKVAAAWVPSGKGNVIVDSEYVRMLLNCGLVFLVAEVTMLTLVTARAFKRGEWHLVLAIALIAVFEISETYSMYAFLGCFFLTVGSLFYLPNYQSG